MKAQAWRCRGWACSGVSVVWERRWRWQVAAAASATSSAAGPPSGDGGIGQSSSSITKRFTSQQLTVITLVISSNNSRKRRKRREAEGRASSRSSISRESSSSKSAVTAAAAAAVAGAALVRQGGDHMDADLGKLDHRHHHHPSSLSPSPVKSIERPKTPPQPPPPAAKQQLIRPYHCYCCCYYCRRIRPGTRTRNRPTTKTLRLQLLRHSQRQQCRAALPRVHSKVSVTHQTYIYICIYTMSLLSVEFVCCFDWIRLCYIFICGFKL